MDQRVDRKPSALLFAIVGGPIFLLVLPASLSLLVRQWDEDKVAVIHLESIQRRILEYREREGHLPASLDLLTDASGASASQDAWGAAITYTVDGESFTLHTLGRDGTEGGEGANADRVLHHP